MTKPLTGKEPAFPSETTLAAQIGGMNGPITRPGISIRLHLAAMAMQGLLSNVSFVGITSTGQLHYRDHIEKTALEFADALIAAYNKEPAHD